MARKKNKQIKYIIDLDFDNACLCALQECEVFDEIFYTVGPKNIQIQFLEIYEALIKRVLDSNNIKFERYED